MKIVYTGGTFDIGHYGHISFLKRAKKLGDYLVVSLNTDEFCKQYKRKPVFNYKQRYAWLKELRCVDSVIPNTGGFDSKPAILKAKPDIMVHGDDWKGEGYMKQLGIDEEFLRRNKITLKYIPYTKGVSTTKIINDIIRNHNNAQQPKRTRRDTK